MAIKKETETKSKVKTAKSATLKAMKDAEEKAVKAVAKVKKAAATKVSKISDEVKKVAAKKTTASKTATTKAAATKTAATKSASTKTATTKTAATKSTATKTAAAKTTTTKTAAKTNAKVASAKASKASEKDVAKLAQSFDAEYLVLMQKDPNWMHAFWEVSENRINEAKHGKGKIVLRLFDIADDLTVQRSKKRKFRDIEVPANARSWYVENTAGKSCVAVLGAVSGKNFMPIVESAPVMTFDKSAAAPAEDDAFAKASLGGNTLGNFMSSGFSSQTAESWLKKLGGNFGSSSESMFSGALSSAALQSNNIEVAKDSVNYGKDFFLWVKTRLIVYGGTRPDAHLQVRGEPFPLNPDGTFSFEEDLPDSTKIIPVFATDKDGDFPTTIVPIVVKRTE
ncbi:hypothetical protein SAMN05720473_101310 [Fibrobacter sp. UWB15]|jgi:hypothetical protein|uniref:DUF4912 domain-containing protein n=1 Tax=unclassified Fibrobacter TaxID=2634177 RepID=UPI000923DE2C|nr:MULTISPECIES: DUF4912 domain-containing protein [unclassified Fibrobacter]PWJ67439.1 hypothetical protein BGW99_101310 [Fibrobacter sp. UWB6]SHF67546.1 hypothetical protein SAMN05720760_101275 [Fibrobacter sp. UWB8]SMG10656.1 hypothetical protein SAMN05720473_101310 [Fibrobacter sp. UWB15]